MFKLLSKESNIFSIPVYLIFLLFIVIAFNYLNFNALDSIFAIITFAGVALGYFLFNKIGLNYQTHLPLFLYTFFIFALYPGNLDIGISVSLFTNSFLLLILTSTEEFVRKSSYVLVGALLAINFIFLPTTWPLIIFVILHIIGTSQQILLNIFRLFFGMSLIALSYLSVAFFFHLNSWNTVYFPFTDFKITKDFYPLQFLIPIGLMIIYAVLDHFSHYNQKSPISRFKYTFILVFAAAQLITIVLYMGTNHEYLLLAAFPATVILGRMLKFFPKYWMKELGLWLIIICLILFKVGYYFKFF